MALGKMQLIAIAVAAVVVVGGIGVAFLVNNDDSNPPNDELNVSAGLAVFGNANNDLKLDSADKTLIQEIIDGKKKLANYPLADADCDGSVDADDIALVNKLIAKESCTVNAVGLDVNGKQINVPMKFPVDNTLTFGTNMALTTINSGSAGTVVGVLDGLSYTGYAQKPIVDNGKLLVPGEISGEGLSRTPDRNLVMKIVGSVDVKLADEDEEIGVLFLDHSAKGLDDYLDFIFDDIPVLRLAVADPIEEIYASRLIGFLTGNDEIALNYASKSIEVIEHVLDAVKDIPEDKKNNYISMTMSVHICNNDSDYNKTGKYVGAVPYYTINNEFATKYAGSGSTQLTEPENTSNYTDIDYVISNRSADYMIEPYGKEGVIYKEWVKKSAYTYFENLPCYENMLYINNILPGAVKIAVTAALISPDYVDMEYAESVIEDFSTFCESFKGVTLENSYIYGTYEDYIDAKGAL